jgi:glycosyltransferase involved in cell wall biosynthesis
MSNHGPDWIVSQIGAREDYAAARAFARLGRLDRLFTDAWCRFGAGLLRRGPSMARVLAGRTHPELATARIVSFTTAAVLSEIRGRLSPRRTPTEDYHEYLRVGRWFDRRVARHLARLAPSDRPVAFFGYDTGCLESIRRVRDRGVFTVVDQIDPGRVEYDLVRTETEKWAGWADAPPEVPEVYLDRLTAEWHAADAVVVNSEWSAEALCRQGLPRAKIHVVPLAFEPPAPPDPRQPTRPSVRRPLTVLWLGNVILRKGIQYLIEAARLLAGQSIRFLVVGPLGISEAAVRSAPSSMEFLGRVTRDRTAEAYRSADLFAFPTLSDGFGLTQLEAMAHGLPVVATPNCGSVVNHGVDGLIVPAGDAAALATAVAELDADRDRLAAMGREAVRKAAQFPLSAFAERLDAVYRSAATPEQAATPAGGS